MHYTSSRSLARRSETLPVLPVYLSTHSLSPLSSVYVTLPRFCMSCYAPDAFVDVVHLPSSPTAVTILSCCCFAIVVLDVFLDSCMVLGRSIPSSYYPPRRKTKVCASLTRVAILIR